MKTPWENELLGQQHKIQQQRECVQYSNFYIPDDRFVDTPRLNLYIVCGHVLLIRCECSDHQLEPKTAFSVRSGDVLCFHNPTGLYYYSTTYNGRIHRAQHIVWR